MIGIFFSILVVMAIFSSCSEIFMRVRLSKRESPANRLLWWRRGGDEVAAMYQELFPRTRLPLIRLFTFWFFIATCTLGALMLWLRKSN
jgi:hypothetical protein